MGSKDSRLRHHLTETCQWPPASSSTGSLVQAGRDDLDPPPEVGSRPGGVPALQIKERKKRREEEEQSRIHVVFWERRFLGLGDLCLRFSFWVEVQRPAAFQSGQCSSHAAFLVGRAGQLPCCFSSGKCNFSCLFGATGPLSVPGGWTSPPLCELRTSLPTDIFRLRVFRVFGLCIFGPQSFFPHSGRQTFQQFLQR